MSDTEPPQLQESTSSEASFDKEVVEQPTMDSEEDFQDEYVPTQKGNNSLREEVHITDSEKKESVFSSYKGIVVTTIALTEVGNGRVRFNEQDDNGLEGAFLKDISMISDPDQVDEGNREFEATILDTKEAMEIIKRGFGFENDDSGKQENDAIPLFIIHGYSIEPSISLKYPLENFKANMKYYPILVMWATGKWYPNNYKSSAIAAGDALSALVGTIPDHYFPQKSLLMHSMGNHVVFNGACANGTPEVEFENIYMVAADLPYDIFNEKPSESYFCLNSVNGNKAIKADNFWGLLKKDEHGNPVGKVYITHNDNDKLLAGSCLMNKERRLGKTGAGWVGGWCGNHYSSKVIREDFRLYIENIDVSDQNLTGLKAEHEYFLQPWMVDIYEKTATGGYLYYE